MQTSGMFFGLLLAPLTWVIGITLFSVVLKQVKSPIQILLVYILFFIHFALIITYVALDAKAARTGADFEYLMSLAQTASRVFTATICLNWGYFLLVSWLVIQHRKYLSKKIMVTLVLFCIMNTDSLIVVIAIFAQSDTIRVWPFFYVLFFFGDLLPALSLYTTTVFWGDLNKFKEQ